jgi:hypothetical protein
MKLFKTNFLLLIICIFYLLCQFLLQEIIITEDHYYYSLSEQLSFEHIDDILALKNEWKWLGYVLSPIILFIKLGVISICLLSGSFLFNFKIGLKKIFRIAVIGEIVLIIPLVLKIIWFTTISYSYTLDDVQFFYPLSLLNLFDPNTLDAWWIYPLQVLNLFEVAYWIVLAILLGRVIDASFDRRLSLVISSYGSGLLIWVIFITFITVNLS